MRASVLLLGALWLGCDPAVTGEFAGPALATVRGQLTAAPGRTAPEPVRLGYVSRSALTWVETNAELLRSPWPTNFSFPVRRLPTASCELVLVAWVDGDGDGTLSLWSAEVPGTDVVVGASLVTTADGGTRGHTLHFVDGELPAQPAGLQQGFNLVDVQQGVVAFSTQVPIELSASPAVGVHRVPGPQQAGWQPDPRPLVITGSVGIASTTSAVILELKDAFGAVTEAQLEVNSRRVPYSEAQRRFETRERGVLAPGLNVITARGVGFAPVTLEVTMPGPVVVNQPVSGGVVSAASSLEVSWQPVPGASKAKVRLFDAAFVAVFEAQVTATSVTIPPLPAVPPGTFTLNVQVDADMPQRGASFVSAYSNTSLSVTRR